MAFVKQTRCAALLTGGVALLAVAACTRQPVEPLPGPPPSPAPVVAATEPPAVTPPPLAVLPAAVPETTPAPESIPALERRYRMTRGGGEEREAIIQTLGGLDSPQALPALRRIFEEEKRLALRMRVLEVAGDRPGAMELPGCWELFSRATEARQPLEMRLSALQSLADSGDPRTTPLLQALSRDAAASVREQAARILRERAGP